MRNALIAALLVLAVHGVCADEEVIMLKTPRGAMVPVLFGWEPGRKESAVALLLAGGEGRVRLREGEAPQSQNFLVRSRGLFLKNGVAYAVVDSPSDMEGMPDAFRASKPHIDDVAAVVSETRNRFPGAKMLLVGTSRGTTSAAYAGASLGDRVDGVVLTASVYNATKRGGAGLSGFDFGSLKAPTLLVHHRQDECQSTPYAGARRLGKDFPLISVSGGDPPRSEPCEALSYHGFLGREEPVVEAISAWILGKPFQNDIK